MKNTPLRMAWVCFEQDPDQPPPDKRAGLLEADV